MMHHIAKNLPGILMVLTQLRTTIVMRKSRNGIHSLTISFYTKLSGQVIYNTIHATNRWNNPNFITDPYFSILPAIAFEG